MGSCPVSTVSRHVRSTQKEHIDNHTPLANYESKSLIEVSSEHTPINRLSRKGSLNTNLDDLATTMDASEIINTTDVGQFTSPLFFQEREVLSHSVFLVLRHMERPMRDTVLFSSIGRPVRHDDSCSSFEKPMSKG